MLTKKQYKLLQFLHSFIQTNGYAPSFEEMVKAMGLHSKSGIHRHIEALIERGFVNRIKNRSRAIEVIKLPPGMQDNGIYSVSVDRKPDTFAGMRFVENPAVPAGEVWFSQRGGQILGKIKDLAVS